jgi:hypothetical protein
MKLSRTLILFLALEAIISSFCLLVYVSVQQSYRTNADDPQIQIARDLKIKYSKSGLDSLSDVKDKIEISTSISPFYIIYDENAKPISSNALLYNDMPQLPLGVFRSAKENGENKISWQPAPGLRFATVIVHVSGKFNGYIMAGRSLQETEIRIKNLTLMAGLAWLFTSAVVLILVIIYSRMREEKKKV